jgi:hypothetical protein
MKNVRASRAQLADDIVVATPEPRLPNEGATAAHAYSSCMKDAILAVTHSDRAGNPGSMEFGIVILFGLASFLASALLFSVQPMIGKMVLPVFGGTPAVWNTCLVFFQGTLLCGYLLSHALGWTGLNPRRRVSVFYFLVFAILLAMGYFIQPIALQPRNDRLLSLDENAAFVLLGILGRSALLPLMLVSATAPLVQSWFALTGHHRSNDPYFLYAASNAGSLLALLAYPLVIEPNLGLTTQSHFWMTGFLIMAILVLACGLAARRLSQFRLVGSEASGCASQRREASLTRATWARWLLLVFIPASWLMGVTAYLTTDLASIPLMWIIPLALYLLSFILAFARSAAMLVRAASLSLPYLIVPLVLIMIAGFVHLLWIPLHLIAFFAGSLACHGALADLRPPPRNLSAFYVIIALGGFLGGAWNALVAPLIFNRVVEYPLALVLVCLAAPGFKTRHVELWGKDRLWDVLFAGVVFLLTVILATNQAGIGDSALGILGVMIASGMGILSCVNARRRPLRFALVVAGVMAGGTLAPGVSGRLLHIERNFFGVLRVTYDARTNVNRLFHGSTLHGQQSLDPALSREPSTYFTRSGPVGQVFGAMERQLSLPGARVAIVGLGAGTLASYARPGQRWTFYEIDTAVERIARDPRFFTYLRDCEADAVDIILGDARQRLQDASDGTYQIIVLDPFSSDALPVHLLSREAILLYRTQLAPGGVLLFHLSNRYVDLDPMMGQQAGNVGLACRVCYDLRVSDDEKRAGKQPSIWAVMVANETDLGSLATDSRWQIPTVRPNSAVWTDDYSDLASYMLFTQWRGERKDRRSIVIPQSE